MSPGIRWKVWVGLRVLVSIRVYVMDREEAQMHILRSSLAFKGEWKVMGGKGGEQAMREVTRKTREEEMLRE